LYFTQLLCSAFARGSEEEEEKYNTNKNESRKISIKLENCLEMKNIEKFKYLSPNFFSSLSEMPNAGSQYTKFH
jgi:hypothetical protein